MPSSYLCRVRNAIEHGIRRSIVGGQGAFQDTVEVLFGQGRSLIGNTRFFNSTPLSNLTDVHVLLQPGTVFAAQPDSHVINQRRNLSVIGALSRAFSIPSVSGPAFQVCGYHIDCSLSEHSSSSLSSDKIQKAMATSPSGAISGDCSLRNFTSQRKYHSALSNTSGAIIGFSSRGSGSCRKACMRLKNQESNHHPVYGYFMYSFSNRNNSNPFLGSGWGEFHCFSSVCSSAGTAPEMTFDNLGRDGQLAVSAISSDKKIVGDRSLKLLSGSCYLPHPDKEETGGEDAHFICVDEQAIGVADGVGGWADLGIDAGHFARELMSNSVIAIREEPKGSIDPARVLEKAHSSTKSRGSSTACIIALTDQELNTINLGDSGFIVVRDGCTVFRSPVQQHDFNFTYQLESGNGGDLPSSGEIFTIPVAAGDVIIAGTDGLFDNLYSHEVTAVVVHAVRAGLGPNITAQKIAALARQRAQDKNRQTPFSSAAQDAGFRYYGGKLDDITVVVSYITSSRK
ncbi:PPM-type phosphatase-like domain [Dillenia turbinata]|uniref:Protein phosphatase n=1 Tax=Dillenia turbinata TaxID=194707 RepID=A0AAN8VXA5_9MAGN